MPGTFESTLPWWIAGPLIGLVIVALLALANKRFGVVGAPRIYLLMGAPVAVAFARARLLRGRRALLTGERIDWRGTHPTRSHVIGSLLLGIGWGISDACPGPTAAQLGGGRAPRTGRRRRNRCRRAAATVAGSAARAAAAPGSGRGDDDSGTRRPLTGRGDQWLTTAKW